MRRLDAEMDGGLADRDGSQSMEEANRVDGMKLGKLIEEVASEAVNHRFVSFVDKGRNGGSMFFGADGAGEFNGGTRRRGWLRRNGDEGFEGMMEEGDLGDHGRSGSVRPSHRRREGSGQPRRLVAGIGREEGSFGWRPGGSSGARGRGRGGDEWLRSKTGRDRGVGRPSMFPRGGRWRSRPWQSRELSRFLTRAQQVLAEQACGLRIRSGCR